MLVERLFVSALARIINQILLRLPDSARAPLLPFIDPTLLLLLDAHDPLIFAPRVVVVAAAAAVAVAVAALPPEGKHTLAHTSSSASLGSARGV